MNISNCVIQEKLCYPRERFACWMKTTCNSRLMAFLVPCYLCQLVLSLQDYRGRSSKLYKFLRHVSKNCSSARYASEALSIITLQSLALSNGKDTLIDQSFRSQSVPVVLLAKCLLPYFDMWDLWLQEMWSYVPHAITWSKWKSKLHVPLDSCR